MAQRQSLRTFDTSGVQGEGSWIKLRPMTVGEVLERQRQGELRDNWRYKLGRWLGRVLRRRPPDSVILRRNLMTTALYVRDWNWVDDRGEPLPLPADDSSVLEHLLPAEMRCITECVNGERQSEEQKN